ncbi:MAG TPA: response regulator [Anaerolineae bacterium]
MADILMIEDSPDFAQFVCAVLELEGHRVRRATRLSEGTTLARSASPDLVLLDVTLPDGNGLDFCHEPDLRSLSVIAMTSATDDDVLQRLQVDVADFIIKPISARGLIEIVNKTLKAQRPENSK